ncbi:MAG: hypothetical protein HY332_07355 [Chloroflexi bacterium]|nr:hypothetical protein [Chloroflexota bacterium]
MRKPTVALRERGRWAPLVQRVRHQARRQPGWVEPDRRTTRTWRQLVLGVLVAHATRRVTVSQVLLGQRAATSVKALALGLASCLTVADFPAATLRPPGLAAARRQLDPAQVATYRGQASLVLDPTEYATRSRGRGRSTGRWPSCGSRRSGSSSAWPCSAAA